VPRVVAYISSSVRASQAWCGRLTDRAVSRRLAPDSLTGISLLLALCAAAWFSGGTGGDNLRGTLALCGWLLARVSAARLARTSAWQALQTSRSGWLDGSTDWLVLPGASWDDDTGSSPGGSHESSAGPGAGLKAIARTDARPAGWLAAICAVAAECAIYGGIAAGGQSAGWTGMWPLAVAAVVAVALRETIGACSPPRRANARPAAVRGLARRILAPPAGARVVVAGLALAADGPRVALFTILAVEVISICVALAGRRDDGAQSRLDVVLVSRDDGPVARWAGRLVQGNLIPLPPALAGVAATVMLAVLGMSNLPGIIALAPLAVMLLAAPGSSHPHTGRFDWLVPVVLQGGQYLYLAALGFADRLPGPVVYSLCALTAIWYANLVAGASPTGSRRIGWEGRMFAAVLGSMLGIATFAYVALAAYLGVLVCRRVVTGHQ